MTQRLNKRHGSVLLLAVWALLLMAALVVGWHAYLVREIELARQRNLGLEASAMAHSGMVVAFHPQVSPRTPLLRRRLGPDRGYAVEMVGEGGRLNLNWLLAGADPARLELFKNFLATLGIDFRQREILVDCLLDWVDPDNVKRLNGLEEARDYKAANRALLSVDELREVYGSGPLTRIPGWERHFTIFSQGPIDLLAADADILALLPGIGEQRASRFVAFRKGEDGLDNTADDPEFKSDAEVRSMLGLGDAGYKAIAGLVVSRDNTWRFTSTGDAGKVVRQLDVVARKLGGAPQILQWIER